MRLLCMHNFYGMSGFKVKIDDDMAGFFENDVIKLNKFGYPSIVWAGYWRPLHCVVYYLKTGIWSVQYKTAIHHKNENKLDAQFENLELKDWVEHAKEHGYDKPPFDENNKNKNNPFDFN